MSLRVWLPLNGDLHNQGTSNITFTGTPAWRTSGKIGNAAYNLSTRVNFNCPALANVKYFSIAFWGMTEANADSTANWMDLLGFTDKNTSGTTGQFRFETGYGNTAYGGIHWHDNTTNAIINGSYTYNTASEYGKWHHIVVTVSNTAVCSYYDGILKSTLTTNLGGGSLTGAGWIGESTTRGSIQDVRIYDHCLSAAEVREISQGLVLHYKLDDIYAETTTNLYSGTFSNTCFNGAIGKYNYGTTTDMYKTTDTFQGKESVKIYMGTAGLDAYPYIYFDAFNTKGTEVHTLSFDYFPTSQTTLIPYSYNGTYNISYTTSNDAHDSQTNVSQIIIPVIINQWNHISITMQKYDTTNTNKGNGYIRIGSAKHTSTTTDYWLFANIQIEAKDHATGYTVPGTTRSNVQIQDSSGYNYNGTIIGNPYIIANSARYQNAMYFIDRPCAINSVSAFSHLNTFTYSCWFKRNTNEGAFLIMGYQYGNNSSGSLSIVSDKPGFHYYAHANGNEDTQVGITQTCNDNQWHHIAATYDGTKVISYFDGVKTAEQNVTLLTTTRTFSINYTNTNSGNRDYQGALSDARVYCTALDADAIRQLYEVGAKVDNKQNIHAFEFIEGQSNIKLTHQGQFKCGEILEYDKTAAKIKKSNNEIEAYEFIEI